MALRACSPSVVFKTPGGGLRAAGSEFQGVEMCRVSGSKIPEVAGADRRCLTGTASFEVRGVLVSGLQVKEALEAQGC